MTLSAAIAFKQGVSTSAAGVALIGVAGQPVTVSNGDNTDVQQWTFEMLDAPPTSTVSLGTVQDGILPSYVFTPDLPGGYYVHLRTKDKFGNVADDFRTFLVPEPSGRIIPAFKSTDRSLNAVINGAQNKRGWATFLEPYLRTVDRSPPSLTFVTSVLTTSLEQTAPAIVGVRKWDPAIIPPGATNFAARFYVIGAASNAGNAAKVDLFDKTGVAVVGGSTLTLPNIIEDEVSADVTSFFHTAPAGLIRCRAYVMTGGTSDKAIVYSARLVLTWS